ncbi:hypothetical protein [Paraburkholderia sp.]|uniref:hypothetical protein n=1 Tax=Paraburkholderia sp. TaxID=1926495 RepID=UPI0023841827|nr:hypothetical protein [Paraburkholderia sp.]MDE1178983.1 hypothetical protein [Paraburkholderia sp.]
MIDGRAVTLYFHPDTGDLRITDAVTSRVQKTRWRASWAALLATLRDIAHVSDLQDPDTQALMGHLRGGAGSGEVVAV